mmetsp:Transcript_31081/g.69017  ORF Transcript_31081/g.69017 Transcript_31081/m.69017 type:complete len:447 (-) Transcript_31081:624-1964(-)
MSTQVLPLGHPGLGAPKVDLEHTGTCEYCLQSVDATVEPAIKLQCGTCGRKIYHFDCVTEHKRQVGRTNNTIGFRCPSHNSPKAPGARPCNGVISSVGDLRGALGQTEEKRNKKLAAYIAAQQAAAAARKCPKQPVMPNVAKSGTQPQKVPKPRLVPEPLKPQVNKLVEPAVQSQRELLKGPEKPVEVPGMVWDEPQKKKKKKPAATQKPHAAPSSAPSQAKPAQASSVAAGSTAAEQPTWGGGKAITSLEHYNALLGLNDSDSSDDPDFVQDQELHDAAPKDLRQQLVYAEDGTALTMEEYAAQYNMTVEQLVALIGDPTSDQANASNEAPQYFVGEDGVQYVVYSNGDIGFVTDAGTVEIMDGPSLGGGAYDAALHEVAAADTPGGSSSPSNPPTLNLLADVPEAPSATAESPTAHVPAMVLEADIKEEEEDVDVDELMALLKC